jgi:AraC-like DNA-binding protein
MDQLSSGRVTEDSVAASLNMSPRTLYNNLRKHGTAFRELILELRKDLAQRYLSEPGYSLTEISFMLGFSDSSSFSRAFKSWFGMSPSRYRETLG